MLKPTAGLFLAIGDEIMALVSQPRFNAVWALNPDHREWLPFDKSWSPGHSVKSVAARKCLIGPLIKAAQPCSFRTKVRCGGSNAQHGIVWIKSERPLWLPRRANFHGAFCALARLDMSAPGGPRSRIS